MAYYTYKQVRDLLPQHIIDKQGPNYEGDPGYDGDQWAAAADYINELKAALAAKDAELWRALHTLEALVAAGFVTQEKVDEARALMANLQPSAPVHPDAARLDKLPQCFHMLRFVRGSGVLPERQGWHLTYETNKVYGSVREAIDAHKGTSE